MKLTGFIICLLILSSCFSLDKKLKRYDNGEYIVEGYFDNDTNYNGLVKYYDPVDNSLVYESYFVNNSLEGISTRYHKNGKKEHELPFEKDKVNGWKRYYDTLGQLESEHYVYYDLSCGPTIYYSNGELSEYYFYSLERDLLFYLDYDSIGNKNIKDLQDEFFYYYVEDFRSNSRENYKVEPGCFLYLPSPPGYEFKYSLCMIDENNKVVKTVEEFDNTNIWYQFDIELSKLKRGTRYALRLQVKDEKTNKSDNFLKPLIFKHV